MSTDKSVHSFNIVRYVGRPNTATINLWNGKTYEVNRQDKIFDARLKAFIPVAPYDDHFVFELPYWIPGPKYQCTCGSMAVIVGSQVYAGLNSPEGAMFVCFYHSTFGTHTNTQSRWV